MTDLEQIGLLAVKRYIIDRNAKMAPSLEEHEKFKKQAVELEKEMIGAIVNLPEHLFEKVMKGNADD